MSLSGLNRVKLLFEGDMMNPWQYLDSLVWTDRGPEHDETWMTKQLQKVWPGPYRVEKAVDYQWQSVEYEIVFNTPADETWFRLQLQ